MDKSKLTNEINSMSIPVTFYGNVKGLIEDNVQVKLAQNSFYNSIRGIVGEPIIIETTYDGNDGLKARFDISSYISILFAISINVIVVDAINMPTNTINVLYSSGWYSLMFILWQLFHDFIMLDITSININDNICRDIASINVILFILSEFKGYETINIPSIKHGYICYITI